jgi:transcriptional regulator with XRE-family HTH domain
MDVENTGRRIARARRRRGLSQTVLAGLVGRSESWLSQVERGRRGVDSHAVLTRLAEVLRIDRRPARGAVRTLPGPAYRAGLPPVRFHNLRHGAASRCKAAGVGGRPFGESPGHLRRIEDLNPAGP